MKTLRIKVVLTMLLTAYAVALAEYLPFLEDGKSWIVALVEDNATTPVVYRKLSVKKEKTFNGQKCREIEVRDVELNPAQSKDDISKWRENEIVLGYYKIYAYEEDNNLYKYDPITGEAEFLFGVKWEPSAGSQLPTPTHHEIEINGVKRICSYYDFHPAPGWRIEPGWIIEGIGPNYNFWYRIRHACDSIQGNAFLVECYGLRGKRLFCADDFNTLLNQVCDVSEIKSDDTPSSLFDLNGRAIPAPQPGEIYIDNGTKKIMR